MTWPSSPLAIIALVCAALSAAIVVGYLVLRPPLGHDVKLWLLFGLGVFPLGTAFSGNYYGFEATKERKFCGGCHLMSLHARDSEDPLSSSLAARHARNAFFGSENCYVCHADYGMFGTVVTKAGGMRHVWLNVTRYRHASLQQAKGEIHLLKPFPNENCMQCHSTRDTIFLSAPDHRASLQDVRAGRIGCASAGCHGLAHPFWRASIGAATALSSPRAAP